LSGWPRDRVLAWRARQRLAGADPGETEAVLAELRDAGFAPLAAELSAANSREARNVRDASDGGAAVALEPARSGLSGRDYSAAGAAARQALASATGAARLEPLLVLAVSEFAAGRPAGALARLQEAQAIAPTDVRAYKLEARVRLAAGDAAGARRAIEQGLAQVPGDTTLMLALRALEKAGATPR
jgi:Flp pilus assembly protein TadD